MNYVCIIGILIEVTGAYMTVQTEDEYIKVFYQEFDATSLEIGIPVKIEGKISNVGFPFDVVLAEKVYTMKEPMN